MLAYCPSYGCSCFQVDLDTHEAEIEYDPSEATIREIIRAVIDCGFSARLKNSSPSFEDITLLVGGMMCHECVSKVRNSVARINGVRRVDVSLDNGRANVTYETTQTDPCSIQAAVNDLGFVVTLPESIKPSCATIAVEGMACELCALSIQRVLAVKPGVISAVVSMEERKILVEFHSYEVRAADLCRYICNAGYPAAVVSEQGPPNLASALFSVTGMTCGSCVANLEGVLSSTEGVEGVGVSLKDGTAAVVFDPTVVTTQRIVDIISDAGYECSVKENIQREPSASEATPLLAPAKALLPPGPAVSETGKHQQLFSSLRRVPYLVMYPTRKRAAPKGFFCSRRQGRKENLLLDVPL